MAEGIKMDKATINDAMKNLSLILGYDQNNIHEDEDVGDTEFLKFNTKLKLVSEDFGYNHIVFGAPGTGKSHEIVVEYEKLLKNTKATFERVTFHPEYSYANFVGCYKPVSDAEGHITYAFVPGPFMRILVEAYKSGRSDSPKMHVLIIEEINRAKVAAVFGDIFQLLDRNEFGFSEYAINPSEDIKKYLKSKIGGNEENYKAIRIPNNMLIWASMNSADQGVFPMDTAFKRRWSFSYIDIDNNEGVIQSIIKLCPGTKYEEIIDWNKLRKAINEKLMEPEYHITEDKLIGPFFLHKEVFKNTHENRDKGETDVPKKFIKAFESKVIMYLFEDAAKQHRLSLFSGCDEKDRNRYSNICQAFEKKGIAIFGLTFKEDYYNKQR